MLPPQPMPPPWQRKNKSKWPKRKSRLLKSAFSIWSAPIWTPFQVTLKLNSSRTRPPPAVSLRRGDPMEIVVKVGMKNTGRTRAVISQAYGEFRTGTWLEDKPVYDFSKGTNY